MMNFSLGPFWQALKILESELQRSRSAKNKSEIIHEQDRHLIRNNIWHAIRWSAEELQIETAERICSETKFLLVKENDTCTWGNLNIKLEELWKTLEWEIKSEHFSIIKEKT